MTDTQKKLALTAVFALAVGGIIAYSVQKKGGDGKVDAGAPVGTALVQEAAAPQPAMEAAAPPPAVDAAGSDDAQAPDAAVADAAIVDAGRDAKAATTGWLTDPDANEERRGQIVGWVNAALGPSVADAGKDAPKRTRLGNLFVPTGKMGVYDCLTHEYEDDEEVVVPAGSYPVDVLASTTNPAENGDVYAAIVQVAPGKIVTIKRAYLFQAGAGTLCLTSPEAAKSLATYERDAGPDFLVGVLHPDGGTRIWAFGVVPKTKLSFALLDTPSDTSGPVYQAYDDKGRIVAIVVPLATP
ncbi:MAG: hypothetical protein HOO96_43180 [Polyangiaceae bacterium]|nr:hypothetical protein [Polyangiaceae bacterium]